MNLKIIRLMGLGCVDALPLDHYRLSLGDYEFRFVIAPVSRQY